LTTKIDSAVDGLGNPLGSILTAGQDYNIIQGLDPEMVITDKAYGANDLIQMIPDMGAMVVGPVGSNRNQQPVMITSTKTLTWWRVSAIKLNSLAVLPGAMKSWIVTSGLCSTWCLPSSGWPEC